MRKVLGVVTTAFVFLLGLVGIASAEEVPGRPSENKIKWENLEMQKNRGKNQNLEMEKNLAKVENLEMKKIRGKFQNLETENASTADQTKAVDMFSKRDDNSKIRR